MSKKKKKRKEKNGLETNVVNDEQENKLALNHVSSQKNCTTTNWPIETLVFRPEKSPTAAATGEVEGWGEHRCTAQEPRVHSEMQTDLVQQRQRQL